MPETRLDRLLFLQAGRCFFCDKPLAKAEASVEHLVPVARDGSDREHNTVACCKALNSVFGSIELKAKLTTILKYEGKFVCPAGVRSADSQPSPSSLQKPTAADRTELALNHLRRNSGNRPRTSKALARHLLTQLLHGASAAEIEQVIARLQAEGYLTMGEQGRITYHVSLTAG